MNTPLGDELLAVGGSAIGLASIPAGAYYAQIAIENAQLRCKFTGSTPNASVGYPLATGGILAYQGNLSLLRFIRAGSTDGVVQAFYFSGPAEVV